MYIEQTLSLSTKSEPYKNARKYYAESVSTYCYWLPMGHEDYNKLVVEPFYKWLADQGGHVSYNRLGRETHATDSYHICPGTDTLEFKSKKDLTVFVLRWS